jgi:hypothetical protein
VFLVVHEFFLGGLDWKASIERRGDLAPLGRYRGRNARLWRSGLAILAARVPAVEGDNGSEEEPCAT